MCLKCGRPELNPWVGKIPWRREPTPVFWPGEFHGLHKPWGLKQLETTEWLSLSLFTPHLEIPKLWKWAPEIHVLISPSVDSDALSMWEPLPKGNMAGMKQSKNRSSNYLNKLILNYNVSKNTFNVKINLSNLFFSMEQNKSIFVLVLFNFTSLDT